MIGLLNVGSLVLGIVAWILPVVNLMHDKKKENKNWIAFSVMSVIACAISLCFQIFYNHHLVQIGDWGTLMDITGTLIVVSAVLLIVTILLNTITLIVYRYATVR